MNQTTNLVSVQFLSWLKDRLQEEAERKEQSARKRTRSRMLARMRTRVIMGLSTITMVAMSIL